MPTPSPATTPGDTHPVTDPAARYSEPVSDAQPQIKYQVRFDWGLAGFQALAAEADVIVLADELPAADASHGFPTPVGSHAVILATLATSALVADWVLARQTEKGDRFSVAVVAVGERRADASIRFAVEDQLVAGAVIDALAERGIDHCSPEAAAAAAGFVGLKRAVKHLVKASETGQALAAADRPAVAASDAPAEDAVLRVVTRYTFPA
jgi:2-phosphosulfolactate phosphatase